MDRRRLLTAIGGSALASLIAPAAEATPEAVPTPATNAQTGWQNWSKSLPATSAKVQTPKNLMALKDIISQSAGAVRPVGAGHSWMPLVPSDGTIIKLDHFGGVFDIDKANQTAWMGAGARLHDVSPVLAQAGLAFRNLGDIDVQSLAGATSTATHGTGHYLPCLAAEIKALRLITGGGDELEISATQNADMLPAARVALGSLGVLTHIQMQLVPRHKLHRRVWFMPHQEVLAQAENLWATHRNF